MPELSTKDRDKLRKDQFAYVDRQGGEHLPIHDESHVRNAISRFNQTDFQSDNAKQEAAKKIMARPSATASRLMRTPTWPRRPTDPSSEPGDLRRASVPASVYSLGISPIGRARI